MSGGKKLNTGRLFSLITYRMEVWEGPSETVLYGRPAPDKVVHKAVRSFLNVILFIE